MVLMCVGSVEVIGDQKYGKKNEKTHILGILE